MPASFYVLSFVVIRPVCGIDHSFKRPLKTVEMTGNLVDNSKDFRLPTGATELRL